jgi:EpsI family protein
MKFTGTHTRNLLLCCLMILSAGLAVAMTPTKKLADAGPQLNLETLVPRAFGDWQVDERVAYQQVSPDLQAKLEKLYSQILTRTYVNADGYRIMLSIPYGANQSDDISAHDPEVCYPSQGFQTISRRQESIKTAYGDIPVRRMEAALGSRHEPVTYWFTVGRYLINNSWDRKLAQMRYAMKGQIPDGILFRVSSIDPDTEQAYRIQERFIHEMLGATQERKRLIGGL